jgi:hypothetical protein
MDYGGIAVHKHQSRIYAFAEAGEILPGATKATHFAF